MTGFDGKVIDRRALGLAYQKPASASSTYTPEYLPANAVDGNPSTYWSSTFADPAWLAVDLGEVHTLSRVRITREHAYSREFAVQVSGDGQNWKEVFVEANGQGGVSQIQFRPVAARWVRLFCTKRGTHWGHAVREFQVFE